MGIINNWIDIIINNLNISSAWVIYVRLLIALFILAIFCTIGFYITKRIIIQRAYKILQKTKAQWDDLIADKNALGNIAHIVPALFVKAMSPYIFVEFPTAIPTINKLTDAYLILVGMSIVFAVLKILDLILSSQENLKDKPVSSYVQLVKIILYIITGILVLSTLLDKSPIYFLSAFGAMTAILLLIFKDTILGLVASVQMSANDMVRVGDWIEMPKFNADGNVLAINLNTVKIQNFDKTITSIPTYYFITDSFKNWRGMQASGGRRIKRSFYINTDSIKFVSPEMRESFKRYHLVSAYITQRQIDIETYNNEHNVDTSVLINGRRMTNIGVFRKYIEHYLKHHPNISQDMTIIVRQLAIESKGVPLEIYCFTNTTNWVVYESIQSDIFDHLLSAAKFFDLDIFQEASSKDFSRAFMKMQSTL